MALTQLSILTPRDARAVLARAHAEALELRRALPRDLHFGCVGFTEASWVGEVWAEPASQAELHKDGLRQYALHPLLTAMLVRLGSDAGDVVRDLQRLGRELPPHVGCIVEAPTSFTTPRTKHGAANPSFLDALAFAADVVWPCARLLRGSLTAIVVRVPHLGSAVEPAHFVTRLDSFFASLPEGLPYALELEDPALLTLPLARLLATRGISPVLSPALGTWQAQAQALPSGPLVLVRVLPAQQAQAQSDNELVAFLASAPAVPRYVIMDEGVEPAPLAIRKLASHLAQAWEHGSRA